VIQYLLLSAYTLTDIDPILDRQQTIKHNLFIIPVCMLGRLFPVSLQVHMFWHWFGSWHFYG